MRSPLFWMGWSLLRTVYHQFRSIPVQFSQWRRFWRSYYDYRALVRQHGATEVTDFFPQIADATSVTQIEPIYFYQDAWAFERIVQLDPPFHVDIASHHKFVALLSKVVPVTMVDIRPLSLPLDTLQFQKGSILDLPFRDNEIPSLSSMCVIEHIGLGRYGDPLDPFGTERALSELKRVVAPGGSLFISLPVDDDNRIFFNAHRAFRESYLMQLFAPFEVVERKYIYGNSFGDSLQSGFGVACYHLRKSHARREQ